MMSSQSGGTVAVGEDQWNRIKDQDINLYTFEHLTFDKEAKNIKWKMKPYSTNDAGITGYQHVEE